MAKRTRKSQKSQSKLQELVVVATADTMEQAKDYETLLKNNDIPAMIRHQQAEAADGKCYALMVPEDMADEANVVIESQDAYDDFYDFSLDDEPEEDIGGDIFEDEF